jgi:excinuclease ABC subunit A
MAEADWLIDLGPEGGDGGGRIVAQGPVADVRATAGSHTARILGEFLESRALKAEPALIETATATGSKRKGRKPSLAP